MVLRPVPIIHVVTDEGYMIFHQICVLRAERMVSPLLTAGGWGSSPDGDLPTRGKNGSGRGMRYALSTLAACAFILCMCFPVYPSAAASPVRESVPIPRGLASAISGDTAPERIAAAFLGIPYRFDGAVNEFGQYSMFADQSRIFPTPGLNCSGLVLVASRLLLGKNITLSEAIRDRLGDSGPGAPDGEDWDFGWDLIMNISEGFPREMLLPGGKVQDPASVTGCSPRGYDIHEPGTWEELPDRLLPGYLFLVSLNVEGHRKGYGLQHYHVGFIHVDESGRAWFYQTTGKGAVSNRRDLKSPQGQASFKRAFANSGSKRKMMLVLAVTLPR